MARLRLTEEVVVEPDDEAADPPDGPVSIRNPDHDVPKKSGTYESAGKCRCRGRVGLLAEKKHTGQDIPVSSFTLSFTVGHFQKCDL